MPFIILGIASAVQSLAFDSLLPSDMLGMLGICFVVAASCFVHPRLATRVFCLAMLAYQVARCCTTILAPVHVLHDEHARILRPSVIPLITASTGALLGRIPSAYLLERERYGTFSLWIVITLSRMAIFYHRTNDQKSLYRIGQYTLVPFFVSFFLLHHHSPSACRRGQKVESLRTHGVTPEHVDSICAVCGDFLATAVLKPCGLGLCPECLSLSVLRAGDDDLARGAKARCLVCDLQASHWVSIRHLDLEDEKEV